MSFTLFLCVCGGGVIHGRPRLRRSGYHRCATALRRRLSAAQWTLGSLAVEANELGFGRAATLLMVAYEKTILAASGIETEGGNEVPSPSDESPTREAGDAHE